MTQSSLFKLTKTNRALFFIINDILLSSVSLYLSYLLRFNFIIPKEFLEVFPKVFIVLTLLKVFFIYNVKLYFVPWRFFSLLEYKKLLMVHIVTYFSFTLIFLISKNFFMPFPRSVIVIDFFISLIFLGFIRVLKRLIVESGKSETVRKQVIIIGAGETGERIARELLGDKSKYLPVGFLDDSDTKSGTYIHGLSVMGRIGDLDNILKKQQIDAVIIAIPTLSYKKIKEVFDIATQFGVTDLKIVPAIEKIKSNVISVKDLKDISLEDLLTREPVKIDLTAVNEFLKGKVVFVSGAGGSIGSEIFKQVLNFSPEKVIAFDIDETELFCLENRIIEGSDKVKMRFIVGDIRDEGKLNRVFEDENIDIVFHASAYKHVPLMEHYPEEAVKVNIFGTKNLVDVACKYKVEKFVNISTDKAVNPTSIMGATKRFSEIICKTYNETYATKFCSVRFGNVLGSRGSVIPLFLEQIKNGGPVTVTHPEMKRYFMTIPEAVLLVFQAGAMGSGGEIFVLDMGEPVKILNLAEELIKLNGLMPYKDVDIVFTGLRPGEKLFEELLTAEEGTFSTKHSKVFVAKTTKIVTAHDIENYLKHFDMFIKSGKNKLIKEKLLEIIPFYKDQKSGI